MRTESDTQHCVWRRTQVASPERNTDILENSKIGHTWLDGAAKNKDSSSRRRHTKPTSTNSIALLLCRQEAALERTTTTPAVRSAPAWEET